MTPVLETYGIQINKDNIVLWKNYLENLTVFLKHCEWLLDAYVLDFFSEDLWGKFPIQWRIYLRQFQSCDLSEFVNLNSPFLSSREVPPLSLLSYRASCLSFALPRKPCSSIIPFKKFLNLDNDAFYSINKTASSNPSCHKSLITEHEWMEPLKELNKEGGQHFSLEHVFRKHLKPKKQHEVVRLSQLTSYVVQATNAQVLIDVGSGQGHLSRLLSYGFDIPCVCLDAEESFIQGARKFDLQLEDSLKKQEKYNRDFIVRNSPRYATCYLHPELPAENINEMLTLAWPELCYAQDSKKISFGLVGLHSCGDLGPTLLRLFTSINSCAALISVGCCYMKLSVGSTESTSGYPLSSYIQNLKNHVLSYIAKEMSCHAIEAYANKLKTGAESLKVHCYRAILEKLIVEKASSAFSHSGLRSIKNAHLLKFHEYASIAISRLDGVDFTQEEFISEDIDKNMEQWMWVVIFYSIRLMLAPAVETLILLDRLLYLYEKGHDCLLAPIFDPILSPRNFVLVARKNCHT